VFGTPVRAGCQFEQSHKENQTSSLNYTSTRAGVFGSLPFADLFSGSITLFSEDVVPDSASRQYILQTHTYGLALQVGYDSRDWPLNPARGSVYDIGAEYNYRKDAADLQRYTLGAEHCLPLTGRQTVVFRWRGRLLQRASAPESYQEFFEVGGLGSVRGYRTGQFYGSRITWLNVEYKYFVDRRSSVYGFFDSGYYERPRWGTAGTGAEGGLVGYGLGGIFATRIGVLKVEYGLGQSDGPMDGKIHIKWDRSF
jgi:outer membrane protein assembly factor BamA